jgi:hypothetical protein
VLQKLPFGQETTQFPIGPNPTSDKWVNETELNRSFSFTCDSGTKWSDGVNPIRSLTFANTVIDLSQRYQIPFVDNTVLIFRGHQFGFEF